VPNGSQLEPCAQGPREALFYSLWLRCFWKIPDCGFATSISLFCALDNSGGTNALVCYALRFEVESKTTLLIFEALIPHEKDQAWHRLRILHARTSLCMPVIHEPRLFVPLLLLLLLLLLLVMRLLSKWCPVGHRLGPETQNETSTITEWIPKGDPKWRSIGLPFGVKWNQITFTRKLA
jgi:hypothetical protein